VRLHIVSEVSHADEEGHARMMDEKRKSERKRKLSLKGKEAAEQPEGDGSEEEHAGRSKGLKCEHNKRRCGSVYCDLSVKLPIFGELDVVLFLFVSSTPS
jgi:hypothetical protein